MIALHVIAKDEKEQIQRIIRDYGQYFDEVVICLDDMSVFKDTVFEDKVKIIPYEWRDDFAHKRNYTAEHTESEYYFRLDTDDSIIRPDRIRSVLEYMQEEGIDVVYTEYIYSQDEDGNCDASHWRETFIKKGTNCYWKKPVHENIFIENMSEFKGSKEQVVKILHANSPDHTVKSASRNFKILLDEFKRDGANTDPRTIAYLGRMFMGGGQWKQAIGLLEVLIDRGGWDEDKYFAWVQIGQCHMCLGNQAMALAAFHEALAINVDYPDVYCALLEMYLTAGDYGKAIHWGTIGLTKPRPNTLYVVDPSVYGYKAAFNLAMAYLGAGDIDTAYTCFKKAQKQAPNAPCIKDNAQLFEDARAEKQATVNLIGYVRYLKSADRMSDIERVVQTIPDRLLEDARVMALKREFTPPHEWSQRSIVIFCGQAWEAWGPPSIRKGIGGSEEAVIYASKEMVKLGYEVTVYNSCGDFAGEYEGVTYREWREFNMRDSFNILIMWRGDMFDKNMRYKKGFVWMHDVPMPDQFQGIGYYDRILALSEYHKSFFPLNIQDKVYVTTNGVNMEDFAGDSVIRNSKRMIYTSSYDRGIEHLLRMWPSIIEEVPDAELHLFYGWNTYDEMLKKGVRPASYKEMMVQLMDQPGIYEHGRVGHKQLAQEMKKSGIYVYPCHFEEINCISLTKAIVAGCYPVVTGYGAVGERCNVGTVVPGKMGDPQTNEAYKRALIEALKNNPGVELANTAKYGWEDVVRSWHRDLFSADLTRGRGYEVLESAYACV